MQDIQSALADRGSSDSRMRGIQSLWIVELYKLNPSKSVSSNNFTTHGIILDLVSY